jgi:hypothetical protein
VVEKNYDILNAFSLQDMLAFSCCVYDGGEAEKIEMDSVREKGWKGKFKQKDRIILPGLNRINGKNAHYLPWRYLKY